MCTLAPGLTCTLSTPASTEAASLERKGFQTRYSTFSPSPISTLMRFSPYTLSPTTMFLVTCMPSVRSRDEPYGCCGSVHVY